MAHPRGTLDGRDRKALLAALAALADERERRALRRRAAARHERAARGRRRGAARPMAQQIADATGARSSCGTSGSRRCRRSGRCGPARCAARRRGRASTRRRRARSSSRGSTRGRARRMSEEQARGKTSAGGASLARQAPAVVARPGPSAPPRRARRDAGWLLGLGAAWPSARRRGSSCSIPSERGPGEGRAVEVVVRPATERRRPRRDRSRRRAWSSSPRLFALWVRVTGGTRAASSRARTCSPTTRRPRELMARLERRPGGGNVARHVPRGLDPLRHGAAPPGQARRARCASSSTRRPTPALLRELGIDGRQRRGLPLPGDLRPRLRQRPARRRAAHEARVRPALGHRSRARTRPR